ncbi:MAG: hypothetical protein ILM98_01885 [Kiritimatiellae bacterium]|nr:hypothetical protein [Kiritimatiellia bacterium]
MNPTTALKTTIALALAAPALLASPDVSLTGGMLNVTVPEKHIGARLLLVWDNADRGDDPADWANSHEVAAAVPAADTHYAVDLLSLGITNGQPCRLITTDQYRMLDMLKMPNETTYIDTGITDAEVYALRFGFYGNECSSDNAGKFSNFIGTSEASNGFTMVKNNENYNSWYWCYRGVKLEPRPTVSVNSINDVSFANGKFTVNGVVKNDSLPAGAIGESGNNMFIGTWTVKYRFLYGWWSYVRFDDADGNAILDYIPMQRHGDDAVGFYDRATGKFVLSTGGGAFTAGTVTNNMFSVTASAQAFTPTNLVGLDVKGSRVRITVPPFYAGESLMVVWDDADRGGNIVDWAHSSIIADAIGNAGGTYTFHLSNLGVQDRQICGVFVGLRLRLLDMLKMASKQTYVDTGIKDSDVYGVRFGFYGNESADSGTFANFIGTYDADNSSTRSGFTIGMNNARFDSWYWSYGTYKAPGECRPTNVRTDSINDAAFTNQVFTLNGLLVNGDLPDGPVGGSGANMFLGTWAAGSRYLFGWWSYARFDDADGNAILDYIPAQRVTDDKVGFYDRASGKFVLSTGGGDFTAGTVTNSLTPIAHSFQTFMKVDIPTVLTMR